VTSTSLHEPQRVVLKFPAPHRDRFITVTEGAVVVLADHQEGVPTLWVEMDPEASPVEWHVLTVATGEFDRIQPTDQHLGSFVVREGRWLVWHMYRRPM
jgi:hypothetical protein